MPALSPLQDRIDLPCQFFDLSYQFFNGAWGGAMFPKRVHVVFIFLVFPWESRVAAAASAEGSSMASQPPETAANRRETLKVALKECLDLALQNNRQRSVSQCALEASAAQHK
jgi:hypothetical protein